METLTEAKFFSSLLDRTTDKGNVTMLRMSFSLCCGVMLMMSKFTPAQIIEI